MSVRAARGVAAVGLPFAGRKVAWSPPAYANRHISARNGKELMRLVG